MQVVTRLFDSLYSNHIKLRAIAIYITSLSSQRDPDYTAARQTAMVRPRGDTPLRHLDHSLSSSLSLPNGQKSEFWYVCYKA
jgi:hypothetical protein